MAEQNPYSHLTAKEREKPSFPTKFLFRNNYLKGEILDFGSGFGKDGEFLRQKGFDVTNYDPHYAPEYPSSKFDTIICNYVLNVLLQEQQAEVMMSVAAHLKDNGKAYFTVRRDINKKNQGYRIHKLHQKPTYQCEVKLPFKSILLNEFTEIYEFTPFQAAGNQQNDCVFCTSDLQRPVITELVTAYAIYDKFTVSEGHALVIPKRHVSSYFELTTKEQQACWLMVNRVQKILQTEFQPKGFNIGINIHPPAGQTIPHAHIHLIPRYEGDVNDPAGGVRNVIPGKGRY